METRGTRTLHMGHCVKELPSGPLQGAASSPLRGLFSLGPLGPGFVALFMSKNSSTPVSLLLLLP